MLSYSGRSTRLGYFSLGNETIDVRIPGGAKTGTHLRVKGKGQINPMSQQRGDLYLQQIVIKPGTKTPPPTPSSLAERGLRCTS